MNLTDIPFLSGARPFVGHMGELRDDRLAFVGRVSREVDRVMRLQALGQPTFVVNHPEVLHELLVEKASIFQKSSMTRFSLYPLAGEGLFTSKWDIWKKQRKIMSPVFQPKQLETYADGMIQCTDRWLAGWRDGEDLELAKETTHITMSIAGKTLFDADTFSDADALGEALTTALDWAGNNAPSGLAIAHLLTRRLMMRASTQFPAHEGLKKLVDRLESPMFTPGAEGRKLRRAIALLDDHVQKMIDARRNGTTAGNDLLAKLITARDEDDGAQMSDKQVRDEVLTLFVAGHETTATALAWAIHSLCKDAALYAAVEREVDALPRDPTFADLPKLALTLRVFKESLRMYPPVYLLGRQASEATSIDGRALPAHAVILLSPWSLHHRPDFWPDPERFDPDRFLPEAEAARPKLSWLPFGAGPRVCIGAQFALMEGQLVLAKMLRRARFTPTRDEVPAPFTTLRPKGGMPMRISLRRPN